MKILSNVVKLISVAMLFSIATGVFAESAPVYDADTMQQQFENSGNDQAQDLPPPPAPDQDSGGFVPIQQGSGPTKPTVNAPSMSMDQRLTRLEQRLDNLQNSDITTRMDSLQSEVQSLRGQVEQLTHQLQQLQNQQKNLSSDLDKCLTQQQPNDTIKRTSVAAADTNSDADASSAADSTTKSGKANRNKTSTASASQKSSTSADGAGGADNQPNVAEEQQIYQTAYNLIKAKKYDEAVSTLQKMLQKYPSGQFASNAHYWLGELYGLMNKNDQALIEFATVVKTYPDSPRVSDAQLKVGLIYASQSKWMDAKAAFKKVINRYPGSASARLASEQLKQIKQSGH